MRPAPTFLLGAACGWLCLFLVESVQLLPSFRLPLPHSLPPELNAGGGAAPRKPCLPWRTRKTIVVRRERDILQRLRFSASQSVHLIFDRSLSLSQGLVFDKRFSCTVLQSMGSRKVTLYNKGWDAPLLAVVGTGNILFVGISLQNAVRWGAPECKWSGIKYGEGKTTCPALYIIDSFSIQYTKASVYGRIDVFRSAFVKLDSLRATMAKDSYLKDTKAPSFALHGVIRVGECSSGPDLKSSRIVISNNVVFGAWELITIYRGAIGVTVRNNYLHSYEFAGIRIGADVSYAFDSSFARLEYNYIYSTPGKELTGDSAALYFCTHWFNPGISVRCNYVIGGDHCYYFDYVTSGVKVYGGVCGYTLDGFKTNGGKYNTVRHVIMIGLQETMSLISCMYAYKDVNCLKSPGMDWERHRVKYYNSPALNGPYPYMKSICNPPKQRTIDGKICNEPGNAYYSAEQTGYCSGIPYKNDIILPYVNFKAGNSPEDWCNQVPTWKDFNRQTYLNVTLRQAAFNGKGDFGLRRSSKIYKMFKGFTNCPRKFVGPRQVSVRSYLNDWNIREPSVLKEIINNDFDNILIS